MDGNREDAMMSTVTGLAVDDSGVLYFLDTGNGLLRKLEDGIVSTVAGRKGNLAVVDGKPLESSLKWPYDLGFDSNGSLYFVECNAGISEIYHSVNLIPDRYEIDNKCNHDVAALCVFCHHISTNQ